MSSSLRLMDGPNFLPVVTWDVPATHLGFLTFQGQTSVLIGLAFWPSSDELERSSSPSRGLFLYLHQESFLSGPGCSKLTTSLVNVPLKFQTLLSKICQYFC